MTRPTRRLRTIIEAMPVFKKVAEGKEWTREIQKEFEEELASANVKTDGITRADSGGKRTWAVYPKIFGLWYEDENGKVVLTQAADKVIAGGEEAVLQVRHQVLRFQWPNRTQEHKSQRMDQSFKIFPYRFLIRLLLDKRIGYLLTSEVSLFVLQVRNENVFEKVVKMILRFRKMKEIDGTPLSKRTWLIDQNKRFRPEKAKDPSYSTAEHFRYLKDLANTFMNHLEFFEEVIHDKNEKQGENQIKIETKREDELKKIIESYDKKFPISPLDKYEEVKWFVENYGNSYDKIKASRKTTKPKTKKGKDIELVKRVAIETLSEKTSISVEQLVSEISKRTGMSKKEIKNIISSNPNEFDWYKGGRNPFAEKYLQVAKDGKKHEEFEEMTRKIFQSIGFPTEKLTISTETGNQLEIDGFVQKIPSSGVIDAKSGKKFSCGNKEVGIMKDYLHGFKKYNHNGTEYCLEFFAYVFGIKFENNSNFERIIKETGIPGARISATELLKLKEKFDTGKITKEQIWKLFMKNGEITSFDY